MSEWYPCIFAIPDPDAEVEFRRFNYVADTGRQSDDSWIGRWADFDPAFNINNLFWRPLARTVDEWINRHS